jgi:tRNA (guanine-N7-)-methyltransferase
VRARHKEWAGPYLAARPEIALRELPPADPFFAAQALFLEIGAGKGDFVIAMGARHPAASYLALEKETSIAGIMAKKIAASGLTNIRVLASDFDVASEALTPFLFDGIYLNFSDPWPKKKHWKRRLTTRGRLSVMAALLKEEGRLYVKTDDEGLYAFTKEEALFAPLRLVSDEPAYLFEESQDAMSEYEKAFRAEGKPIHRLVYGRK